MLQSRFVLVVIVLAALSNVEAIGQSPRLKTFTSPDGTFQFTYPDAYPLYDPNSIAEVNSHYFVPMCEDTAIACIEYPGMKYKGTDFERAGFEVLQTKAGTKGNVSDRPQIRTLLPEYSYRTAFVIPKDKPVQKINGVRFVHGEAGGVATGNSIGTDLYRNFHDGKCYELRINIIMSNIAHDEPDTQPKLSHLEYVHIESDLNKILLSLKFLK
jgi:hypothetical protein